MALVYSKLTARGQTSVPAKIRSKLGVGPGGVLEWKEEDGKIVVRRAGRFSSEDLHRALFPKGAPKPRALKALKRGVARYIKGRRKVEGAQKL